MKKKNLVALPLFVLSLVFAGCSKDDDSSSVVFDKSKAVGKWTITNVSGNSTWYWISEGNTLTFNSDGTCSTGFSMENSWKIENGCIATYYAKTSEPCLIYNLLSIDGSDYNVKVIGTLDESNESVIIKMKKR